MLLTCTWPGRGTAAAGATLAYGVLGAVDDYCKMARRDNYGGVSPKGKLLAQAVIGGLFAAWVMHTAGPDVWSVIRLPGGFELPPLGAGLRWLVRLAPTVLVTPRSAPKILIGSPHWISLWDWFDSLPSFSADKMMWAYWLQLLWPLALFTMTAESNAVNLTDGLDGLAAGGYQVGFAFSQKATENSMRSLVGAQSP